MAIEYKIQYPAFYEILKRRKHYINSYVQQNYPTLKPVRLEPPFIICVHDPEKLTEEQILKRAQERKKERKKKK